MFASIIFDVPTELDAILEFVMFASIIFDVATELVANIAFVTLPLIRFVVPTELAAILAFVTFPFIIFEVPTALAANIWFVTLWFCNLLVETALFASLAFVIAKSAICAVPIEPGGIVNWIWLILTWKSSVTVSIYTPCNTISPWWNGTLLLVYVTSSNIKSVPEVVKFINGTFNDTVGGLKPWAPTIWII